MTTWTTRVACALLAVTAIAGADNQTSKPKAQATKPQPSGPTQAGMPEAKFVNASDLKWMAAPPEIPKGAQMTVLYGNPMRPGTFVMRLKVPDGYKIPPHWHTQDEHLTVLAGQFALHVGDTMKGEPHVLAQGGYHYLPGGLHHAAEARGETIIEITGHGPFDIRYVNPADNPVQQSARR